MKLKSKYSLCEACGVEIWTSGNYSIRVIPAKKIPKKALKLYHNPQKDEKHHPWGQSRFQKYLLARSNPKNTLEVTCGNCSAKTTIKMNKPKFVKPHSTTPGSHLTTPLQPGSNSSRRRNKPKKTPKDVNAGLIIPSSMLSNSPSTPVTSLLQTTELFKKSGSHSGSGGRIGRFNPVNPLKKKAVQAEKQSKQKGMDNLKKVLYKSKQMGSSSSLNLQNFFGSS